MNKRWAPQTEFETPREITKEKEKDAEKKFCMLISCRHGYFLRTVMKSLRYSPLDGFPFFCVVLVSTTRHPFFAIILLAFMLVLHRHHHTDSALRELHLRVSALRQKSEEVAKRCEDIVSSMTALSEGAETRFVVFSRFLSFPSFLFFSVTNSLFSWFFLPFPPRC